MTANHIAQMEYAIEAAEPEERPELREILAFVEQSVSSGDCVSVAGKDFSDLFFYTTRIMGKASLNDLESSELRVDDSYKMFCILSKEEYSPLKRGNPGDCVSVPRKAVENTVRTLDQLAIVAASDMDRKALQHMADFIRGWLRDAP